jgi:hypothetical protein
VAFLLQNRHIKRRPGKGGPKGETKMANRQPVNYQSSSYKKQAAEFQRQHGNMGTPEGFALGRPVKKMVVLETTDLMMPEFQAYLVRHAIKAEVIAPPARIAGAGERVRYTGRAADLRAMFNEFFYSDGCTPKLTDAPMAVR